MNLDVIKWSRLSADKKNRLVIYGGIISGLQIQKTVTLNELIPDWWGK